MDRARESLRSNRFAHEGLDGGPRISWRLLHCLFTLALGLFILAISDHAPFWKTKGKDTGTVITEKESTVSLLARQNQGLVPVRVTSLKSKRPQRLAHNRQNGADTDALLLKQDAAWRALWR